MGFNWDLDQSSTRSIVYNCRSAASWPQDMALSVTFLTDSLTTNAVLFGCDAKTPSMSDNEMTLPDLIISRLSNSDAPAYHPMLLPTIFADIERDRQIVLVREKLQQLSQRVVNLVKISSEPPNPVPIVVHDQSANLTPTDRAQPRMTGRSLRKLREVASWMTKASSTSQSNSMQEEKATQQSVPSSMEAKKGERPTAMLWLEISRLRNGLGNWQRQLHKMIDHVDMLNATEFSWEKPSSNGGFQSNPKLRQLFEAGSRIKERLQVLVDEYDEHMRDCTHIMDGLNLATQLELSHIGRTDAKTNLDISRVNLDVARMTRRDSSLMKSIAMLGMIFLPATLVTAFFSMDFFDWRGEEAGYLWVYAVAVAALTLLTVGIFYVYVLRRQRSRNDGGEDKPFMSA
ncbi:Fc.00g082970.m01.CDS01 [Cosmosporella sp. VM-42]